MKGLFRRPNPKRGDEAEAQACRYLQQQGLECIARNVRSRFGEIDLIMRQDATLLFVEVRYRRSARFGGAAASVDRHKQRRLIATAQHYLQRHPHPGPCRFDVVAINGDNNEIEWLQHAFELSE